MAFSLSSITSTAETIGKIGGPVGSLFSIGSGIYSSIETAKYRKEVLDKLNTLLEGQKEIDKYLQEILDKQTLKSINSSIEITKFDILLSQAKRYFNDSLEPTDDQKDNFFRNIKPNFNTPAGYHQFLSNLLDDMYIIMTDSNRLDKTVVTSHIDFSSNDSLVKMAYNHYAGNSESSNTSTVQKTYFYYLGLVRIVFQALNLLSYGADNTDLSEKEKKDAANYYQYQMNAWYTDHYAPDPIFGGAKATGPKIKARLDEIAGGVQAIFNQMANNEKDYWRGWQNKYNKNLEENDSKISLDWVEAGEDEVIVGWEFTRLNQDGDHVLGLKIYTGKLGDGGWVNPNTIGSKINGTGSVEETRNYGELSAEEIGRNGMSFDKHPVWLSKGVLLPYAPKAWSSLPIDTPESGRVQFKLLDENQEAMVYWIISAIQLSIGNVYNPTEGKFRYIKIKAKVKPLVYFNHQYYLGKTIPTDHTTEISNGHESRDIGWCRDNFFYGNDVQYDTGGPSGGSLLVPVTSMKFQGFESDRPHTMAAHSRLDLHIMDPDPTSVTKEKEVKVPPFGYQVSVAAPRPLRVKKIDLTPYNLSSFFNATGDAMTDVDAFITSLTNPPKG